MFVLYTFEEMNPSASNPFGTSQKLHHLLDEGCNRFALFEALTAARSPSPLLEKYVTVL